MFYKLFYFPAKVALVFWCRNLKISNSNYLKSNGPILIAANHPNSFLDAILLCTIFKQPIYSLARGDAFKNNWVAKVLRSLKMFPIYRLSEGAENLDDNYTTFEECINVFKKNGIVLIFSEGKCINEWHLRPLKKGTARLAISAWQQDIPLKVLPVGINYQSFYSFGKNVQLNFGEPITKATNDDEGIVSGKNILNFNTLLRIALEKLVIEVKPVNNQVIQNIFKIDIGSLKKIILFPFAIFGYIFHAPLYIPIKFYATKKFSKIDHYDSVMVGLLFLLYPFYMIIIGLVSNFIVCGYWWILVTVLLPFTAYSFIQIKKQF